MSTPVSSLLRILGSLAAIYLLVGCAGAIWQRKLLFHPTHEPTEGLLKPWEKDGLVFGCMLEARNPAAIWLMLPGNAGQASHREYALGCFPPGDSVYVLEYPGFGLRPGAPSLESINAAAEEAYAELRRLHPGQPIYLLGESIGSGPACHLCTLPHPPEKLFLVIPFDRLVDVAADAMPILPVRLIMLDRWDNIAALSRYSGPVEIFGAEDDEVIPVRHAQTLARSVPQAKFHLIAGRHNEWSQGEKVRLARP